MNSRNMAAAASFVVAERTSPSSTPVSPWASQTARIRRTSRSPKPSTPSSRSASTSSAGLTGRRIAAANSAALLAWKWWTRAGSTPAAAATARTLVAS